MGKSETNSQQLSNCELEDRPNRMSRELGIEAAKRLRDRIGSEDLARLFPDVRVGGE